MDWLGLAALPSAVPVARYFTRALLSSWGLDESHGWACQQVLSELVTNSLDATRTRSAPDLDRDVCAVTIFIRFRLSVAYLIAEVRDTSTAFPEISDAGPADEGGRGLWLAESLASAWGVYALGPAVGKVVWASWKLGREAS